MAKADDHPRWVFDALPPSGARRGGDPSEHAFTRTLDTFVREALQNANDQSLPGAPTRAEVCFDLEELSGSEHASFLAALGWDTLRLHLHSAAAVHGISKFRPFVDKSHVPDRLILRVEDRHTSGLGGDEDSDDSNFSALCRDSLFSRKQNDSAGGSYGLGKSVYWAFSSLSTVVFHSYLATNGRRRLIGRVELPSHAIGDEHFMGPGWFGRTEPARGGLRAVSVWDDDAQDLARRLHIDRQPKVTGTTILVVGFRDPTGEGQDGVPALLDKIRQSAVRYFWPAMHFARPLRIQVGGMPVSVSDEVAPFVTAWQQRDAAGAQLVRPGDVARRSIPTHLPRRREGKEHPDQRGICELIVRLAEPAQKSQELGALDNRVALFRGAGMVVKYFSPDPTGILPRFHAILAVGTGRADRATPSDEYVEAFFRASEPPGHDEWHLTERLRVEFTQGGGARITNLFDEVRKALREMLLPPTSDAQRGPELLQRRYPLGAVGTPQASAGSTAFHFTGLEATFSDGCWRFAGTVEPKNRGHAWTVTIALKILGDDGGNVDDLKIAELTLRDPKRGKVERTADGAAILSATRTTDGLAFTGISERLADGDQLCELGLEISGELLALERL